MLSVLIPIYNFDVRQFVKELHKQAENENINFEIILADDASDLHYDKINSELSILSKVKYIRLDKNIGRSRIRNFLAEQAKYDYLLFADCDSEIPASEFTANYIKNVNRNTEVICGGRTYKTKAPENKEKYFRWYYGKKREVTKAEKRNTKPYASFMTNNYLIKKTLHKEILFDENLTQYGHEDTLFGIELKRKNIKIKHIDNPLTHIGLENFDTFIEKTKNGIKNLIFITENYDYPELYEEIKLLRIARKLRFLDSVIIFAYKLFEKIIPKNLKSKKPLLFLFDFYKLGYCFFVKKYTK